MWEWLATESALWALFASAFISSTLFPGGSEAVLLGIVASRNTWEGAWPALLVATAGNTLGSLTGWAIGRFFSRKILPAGAPQGGENSFACQAPRRLASSLFLAARRGGFPARRVGLAAASVSSLRPLYRRREISAVSPSDSALVRYFGVNRKEEFSYKNASFVRL